MFDSDESQFFESVLFENTGKNLSVRSFEFMGGGCINNTVKLETAQGVFFLKWNESTPSDLFEKEAKGLELLRSTHTVRVPEVINYGIQHGKPYLLLEYLSPAFPKKDYWQQLGTKLAALHRHSNGQFGLHFDNYIGTLPQQNDFADQWIDFFTQRRLHAQAGLAYYKGLIDKDILRKFEKLYLKLPDLLPGEVPALLHGDLWSGNVIADSGGQAAVIDPAVYYGHREMELAFTRLFGGFEPEFYESYGEAFPLSPGFEERVGIYNLYPLLVHVNLFGTGYLSGVEKVLRRFV